MLLLLSPFCRLKKNAHTPMEDLALRDVKGLVPCHTVGHSGRATAPLWCASLQCPAFFLNGPSHRESLGPVFQLTLITPHPLAIMVCTNLGQAYILLCRGVSELPVSACALELLASSLCADGPPGLWARSSCSPNKPRQGRKRRRAR